MSEKITPQEAHTIALDTLPEREVRYYPEPDLFTEQETLVAQLRSELAEKERELADSQLEQDRLKAQVQEQAAAWLKLNEAHRAQLNAEEKFMERAKTTEAERDHFRLQAEQLAKAHGEVLETARQSQESHAAWVAEATIIERERNALRESVIRAEYEFGRIKFAFDLTDERHEMVRSLQRDMQTALEGEKP